MEHLKQSFPNTKERGASADPDRTFNDPNGTQRVLNPNKAPWDRVETDEKEQPVEEHLKQRDLGDTPSY